MVVNELDALDPQKNTLTLKSGFEVQVLDLKMRQIFKLFRIVTHGMANSGFQLNWPDPEEGLESFVGQLIMMVTLSVGDAEEEVIDFIKSIVVPAGLITRPGGLQKPEAEANKRLWAHLDGELANPDPFDFLDIIESVITREGADLQALGKRIAALWKTFQKAGGTSQSQVTSTDQNTSEPSADPSTYSNGSTTTPTMNVVNLPSEDFDRNSQLSMSTATTTPG